MKLTSFSYKQSQIQNGNPWELSEFPLRESNLLFGKNATGKTRILRCINAIAILIKSPQQILNGHWQIVLNSIDGDVLTYELVLSNGVVAREKLSVNGENKLIRTTEATSLWSSIQNKMIEVAPPNDRLTVHVRRDEREFPYLENLVKWAESVRAYYFGQTMPFFIEIPSPEQMRFESLGAVPFVIEKLTSNQLKSVLESVNAIGFPIEDIKTTITTGLPPEFKILLLKESQLQHLIPQSHLSQGLFRTVALLATLEYLKHEPACILIDDLGEGLDSERSQKLADHLFKKENLNNQQLIAASNDYFLINAIPLESSAICYREGHQVNVQNCSNNPQKFDEWKQLGLTNFDLFSSDFLKQA